MFEPQCEVTVYYHGKENFKINRNKVYKNLLGQKMQGGEMDIYIYFYFIFIFYFLFFPKATMQKCYSIGQQV